MRNLVNDSSHYIEPGIGPEYPEAVSAAEKALMAVALVAPSIALDSGARSWHLFNPRYKAIYESIEALTDASKDVDVISVSAHLESTGLLDSIGGFSTLSALSLGFGSEAMASSYAEIIRKAHTGRSIRRLCGDAIAQVSVGADPGDVLGTLESGLIGLSEESPTEGVLLSSAIDSTVADIRSVLGRRSNGETIEVGLPTGLGIERIVPGGIPQDKMTLLFGETGMFKTAVKQCMADSIAMAGYHVIDFSIEDSTELTAERFLSRYTGIPYSRLSVRDLSAEELVLVETFSEKAREAAKRIYVVGNVPSTIEQAVRLSRKYARSLPPGQRLGAVFIDYIQLLDIDQNQEAKEIYRICRTAQRTAKWDKTAWVLVSQVNRNASGREDKRPWLRDVYGSSGVEHTTKLALGLYRPAKYEPEPGEDSPWQDIYKNHPEGKDIYRGALEIWIRKAFSETNVSINIRANPATGVLSPL